MREEGAGIRERKKKRGGDTPTYNECYRLGLNSYIINTGGKRQQGLQGFNYAYKIINKTIFM